MKQNKNKNEKYKKKYNKVLTSKKYDILKQKGRLDLKGNPFIKRKKQKSKKTKRLKTSTKPKRKRKNTLLKYKKSKRSIFSKTSRKPKTIYTNQNEIDPENMRNLLKLRSKTPSK